VCLKTPTRKQPLQCEQKRKNMSIVTIEQLQSDKIRLVNSLSSLAQAGLKTDEQRQSYKRGEESLSEVELRIAALQGISRKLDASSDKQTRQAIEEIPQRVARIIPAPAVHTSGNGETRAKAVRTLRDMFAGKLTNEVRDLVSNVDVQGQALVQQEYASSITRAAAYVSPIVNMVNKEVFTAGRSVRWPVADDTARIASFTGDGVVVAPASITDPVLFSTASASSDAVVSKILFSKEFSQDVANWDGFLDAMAGESIARAVSSGLLTGKDQLGNVLPNQSVGGLIGSSPKGATSASKSALTYADLTSLAASVNLAYFNRGSFLVASNTYQYLLAQVDSTGRELYKIDEATGQLKVAGKLVYAATELSSLGTVSVPVALFGDFSKAYGYAQGSTSIVISTETHAEQLLNQAIISHRFSGESLVASAVKALYTPAS
jgi:HK97 family phage major capsid protein